MVSLIFGIYSEILIELFQNNFKITPTFALSDLLIVSTIALPIILSWGMGLFAIREIMDYNKLVAGSVYRQFLQMFVWGFSLIIVLTILLQLITQFTNYWAELGDAVMFVAVYAINSILIIGYYTIAKAAKDLSSIENL